MTLPATFSDRSVCVIGLGYVGLTLAVTMAEVGFDVLGVEIRKDVVEALHRGEPHFHEPNMPEVLKRVMDCGRLRIVEEVPSDVAPDIYIITVGTPLNDNGVPRLDMVTNAARQVAEHFKPGAMVIMRSTVKIGVTRDLVIPILQASGKPFSLAFCPERTVEGQALQELRYLPQIVGGNDYDAAVRAAQVFQFLTPTVVRVSSLEAAEMVKLIDNVQRDVIFGFSNEVAQVCDVVGVSATEVIKAGKLGYPRTNLFLPGPVGGPCLSKDPYILLNGLADRGADAAITRAARLGNEQQLIVSSDYIAKTARERGLPEAPTITLMGLAFKGRPATDDLRGTTALPVLAHLRKLFPQGRFRAFDAVVSDDDLEQLGLEVCPTIGAAFAGTHIGVILNNHPIFSSMAVNRLAEGMGRPGFLYDFWNNFDARDLMLPSGTGYIALGSHCHAALSMQG